MHCVCFSSRWKVWINISLFFNCFRFLNIFQIRLKVEPWTSSVMDGSGVLFIRATAEPCAELFESPLRGRRDSILQHYLSQRNLENSLWVTQNGGGDLVDKDGGSDGSWRSEQKKGWEELTRRDEEGVTEWHGWELHSSPVSVALLEMKVSALKTVI